MCASWKISGVAKPLGRRAAGEESGAELVEFALVMPLLFMLLFGIVWFARAYNVYQTITRAAREGARELAMTSCATCTTGQCGRTNTGIPTANCVRTTFVEPALVASHMDPAQVSNYQTIFVWMDPLATPPQECGVSISFTYPFTFYLPFTSLNLSTINIGTEVQMRLENQPTNCNAGTTVP